MRNMKYALLTVMMLSTIMTGCSNKKSEIRDGNGKDVFMDAKIDEIQSVQELEHASDLIVIGEKTKELESAVKYGENGEFLIAYTYSDFSIEQTIKNIVNEQRPNIRIFENQAYDETYNEVIHIAGYINMIVGNRYILYLDYVSEEDYYVPIAAVFGKIPLTETEINDHVTIFTDEPHNYSEYVKDIHKQVQKQYENEIK